MPKQTFITRYSSCVIVLLPILSPYVVASIPCSWLLYMPVMFNYMTKKHTIHPLQAKWMLYFALSISAISLFGFFVLQDSKSLLFAIIGLLIDGLGILSLWSLADSKLTFRYAVISGILCGLFALFQMFLQIIGQEPPSGQIPFLELGSNVIKWVDGTFGFRFNSVFSEPSYFAMYLLPIFIYCLLSRRQLMAIAMAFFILLSSSTFGIVGALIVFIYYFLFSGSLFSLAKVFKLAAFGVAGYALLSLISKNSSLADISTLTFQKFENSTSVGEADDSRLFGTIVLFENLPYFTKIFGVGWAQLGNYFKITNYANSIIKLLVENGLVGFAFFCVYLVSLVKYCRAHQSLIFLIIIILGLSIDSMLFTDRYYFMLYFVFYFFQSIETNDIQSEKIKS